MEYQLLQTGRLSLVLTSDNHDPGTILHILERIYCSLGVLPLLSEGCPIETLKWCVFSVDGHSGILDHCPWAPSQLHNATKKIAMISTIFIL